MAGVLVVTPLRKELDALAAAFRSAGHPPTARGGRIATLVVADLDVTLAAAGHGKAQLAVATQHLLEREQPGALVVAGAAGALHPTLQAGDVVIGTESVEHDYKLRFHGIGPPPRHAASEALRAEILGQQPEHAFRVHSGPIAGGDEDIVDADRARELHRETGALCVAWEGPGGARAAAFSGVPFVEVRAVTDAADGGAAESYRVHLVEAVGHIARVLLPWLRSRSRTPAAEACSGVRLARIARRSASTDPVWRPS